MTVGSHDQNANCSQCQAIARRLSEAYNEGCLRNQAAKDALDALIGGTEDDAERADELLATYRFQAAPGLQDVPERIRVAIQQASLHTIRTGHFVRIAYR
jgi:hypothetical protein